MRRPPVRSLAAHLSRRHRIVLLTYPGLRMGNVLYFALQAQKAQRAGQDLRVLDPEPQNDWAAAFPRLAHLLLPPDRLRFTDRRRDLVPSFFQGFDTDFTRDDLVDFVEDVLLSSPRFDRSVGSIANVKGESVTVNIRRGDYYPPAFESAFGFDVETYVGSAMEEISQQVRRLVSVHVVSDDPQWCREKLGWLRTHAPVSFEGPETGVLGNFFSIVRSRRLIITNSTFSYWGAYASNVLHGDNRGEVWAPRLHSRAVNGGRPWQHDPRWNVLDVAA